MVGEWDVFSTTQQVGQTVDENRRDGERKKETTVEIILISRRKRRHLYGTLNSSADQEFIISNHKYKNARPTSNA